MQGADRMRQSAIPSVRIRGATGTVGDKMRSFSTVQEAVDFIVSSERPEGLEVCVLLPPSEPKMQSQKLVAAADDGRTGTQKVVRRQI